MNERAGSVRERDGALASRWVLWALLGSVLGALVVAWTIYVRYVRFEATAASHVPHELDVVVRVDVQQAVVYEPFRNHLLRLLEAGRRGPELRLLGLERHTTLELGVDTREVVVGFGPEHSWLVALGGLFRRDNALSGVASLLQEEGQEALRSGNPDRLRVGEAGFGVASDGTLLLAGGDRLLVAALPRAPGPRLSAAAGELIVLSARRPQGYSLPGGRRVRWLRASVRAGADFAYEVEMDLEGPPLSGSVAAWGREAGEAWSLFGVPHEARIVAPGPGRARLAGQLSRVEFDQLMARLASELRSAARLPI